MRTNESLPPLKTRLLSDEMATQRTMESCWVLIGWAVYRFSFTVHKRTVWSELPETIKDPSSEKSRAGITPVWPLRMRQLKNFDCWRPAAKQFFLNKETRREETEEEDCWSSSAASLVLFSEVDAIFALLGETDDGLSFSSDLTSTETLKQKLSLFF